MVKGPSRRRGPSRAGNNILRPRDGNPYPIWYTRWGGYGLKPRPQVASCVHIKVLSSAQVWAGSHAECMQSCVPRGTCGAAWNMWPWHRARMRETGQPYPRHPHPLPHRYRSVIRGWGFGTECTPCRGRAVALRVVDLGIVLVLEKFGKDSEFPNFSAVPCRGG